MSCKIDRSQYIPLDTNNNNKMSKKNKSEFEQLLQQNINSKQGIKISSHAQQRMDQRNIQLEQPDIDAISDAMDTLKNKGARESLMMYKDMALIASISNRTIITALQENETDIITNIDSAIIIK